MPARSSSSSSPSRERTKKQKSEKKGRNTEVVKKARENRKESSKRSRQEAKHRSSPSQSPPRKRERREERREKGGSGGTNGRCTRSGSPSHRRSRVQAKPAPTLEASGLLDQESGSEDAPPSRAAPAVQRGMEPSGRANPAARSRSRDEPVARREASSKGKGGFGLGGKGDGKGFGKGGGKDGKGKDGKGKDGKGQGPVDKDGNPIEKEKPSFEASGLLGMEDNSKNGIALKFTAPAEARLPGVKWRLYIFTKQVEKPKIVHIHRMLGILFGKDRRVVDVPTDHPTCSKQHAVLHYRFIGGEVRPYIMDLESTNGTFLNGERLDHARYYEMKETDVLKFGMSSREFVLLHAGSANHMEIDPSKLQSDSE